MGRVAFIESNFSGVDAIKQCRLAGIETVLVTSSVDRLIALLPAGCGEDLRLSDQIVEVADSGDVDGVARAIFNAGSVDAVCTFSQPFTVVTSEVARRLDLPGPPPSAVRIARQKYSMRQCLERSGIESVRAGLATDLSTLRSVAAQIGFPLVIKPNEGQASINVHICRDQSDFERAIHSQGSAQRLGTSTAFVVEEFLEGPLYSVEALTVGHGQHVIWGIADRVLANDSIEVASSFPVMPPQYEAIVTLVKASLDAIGYTLGASHTEVIMTSGGPRIVEINLRAGGSGQTHMISEAAGRPVCLDVVKAFLGQTIEPWTGELRGASWFVGWRNEAPSVIRSIPSRTEAMAFPGITDYWLHKVPGSTNEGLTSNFGWILQVLANGEDAASALEKARRAAGQLTEHVQIEPYAKLACK
jgi:cysteine synthase A